MSNPEVLAEEPREPVEIANEKERTWSDTRLVRSCLAGNECAWSALIDRYKRLIYSVPIKYGASPEDAADIFQAVCLDLFSELPNLRKTESLKSWLITVASHHAYRWKKRRRPGDVQVDENGDERHPLQLAASDILAPEQLQEIEREQMLREAIDKLNTRCAEMIRMLFYESPPPSYAEVAKRLGLATGSIGFIRARCLRRLQKILVEMGF